ncbi:hypothetical protein BT93_L2768 [Corymbia citriodora subsp. variegata]|uniref:RING-type E3 ubiquitin transferase n=1 Tax=Corymbia citriodora subsp. variegata TaxID=360336 RepID=A0A8T0CP72_CORYI|nr:hypothetical protein BT93_L2768 [Corymbia citriodora subsp. variegata]
MAVVDRIRVPEFMVPAIMPGARGVASELVKLVSKDKIYVAVGNDVKEGKSKLVWTVRQSKSNFEICIIHVLVPSLRIPMGGLGAGIPASSANEIVLREHREKERKNMHELLENCLLVCRQMGVQAEKECIESDSFEKGIMELICLHGIRKLVMGNGTDKRYFKEALTVQAVAEVPTNVRSLTTPTPEAGQFEDAPRGFSSEVSGRQGDSSSAKYFHEFSMTEIKEAVQNFDPSLKIGEGASGIVYKGFLQQTPVAIKTMKSHCRQDSQQFQQEVDVLSKVRHRHLITLIGACPEPWTLVYEYVPNGSLGDWLFVSNRAKHLSWQVRTCIATELCTVLAYLHSCKPHSIVHGDVKPGNILLDAHLMCKLSDFGISRMLSRGERSSNNTTIVQTDPKGTFGYMDPEFFHTQELTTKCDVYSFGIILLQLLTRKPASGITKDVQRAISEKTLGAILDPLAGEWPYTLAEELTRLALRCCEMSRSNRPDLQSDVMAVLKSIGASYL